MSGRFPFDHRVVAGLAVGGVLAAAVLGPRALPWGLGIALGALGWALWRLFDQRSRGRRAVEGLVARWLDVPGAERGEGPIVLVHHGVQPIVVRLGRERGELRAIVSTRIAESPVAFRIWPGEGPAPTLDPEGAPVGGPPVSRATVLESRLGHGLRADASDEPRALDLLGDDVLAAVLAVAGDARRSFGGVTYDGQRLAVHLRGPVCADPDRAARLARVLWRPFTGASGDDDGGLASPTAGGY
jgi:hypothetical protein